jgi:hypothetical protein
MNELKGEVFIKKKKKLKGEDSEEQRREGRSEVCVD